jgi:hypothetical protein
MLRKVDIYSGDDKDAYNLTRTVTDIMILYCSMITFLAVMMGLLLCICCSYTILNFLAVMELYEVHATQSMGHTKTVF